MTTFSPDRLADTELLAREIAKESWVPGSTHRLGWEPRDAEQYANADWRSYVPAAKAVQKLFGVVPGAGPNNV